MWLPSVCHIRFGVPGQGYEEKSHGRDRSEAVTAQQRGSQNQRVFNWLDFSQPESLCILASLKTSLSGHWASQHGDRNTHKYVQFSSVESVTVKSKSDGSW